MLAAACGASKVVGSDSTNPSTDAGDAGDPTAHAGSPAADAGTPADAGAADAGTANGDSPSDAGPAAITAVACDSPPQLLWSRTFTDEVDFRGVADENGNLYWIEYDPAQTSPGIVSTPFLVSADGNGKDRYRVQVPLVDGVFIVASSRVLLGSGSTILAYDTATGGLAWSRNLGDSAPGTDVSSLDIVDLGNGELAVSLFTFKSSAAVVSFIDAFGGALRATLSPDGSFVNIQGSDGQGSLLVSSRLSETSAPPFQTTDSLSQLDSLGKPVWSENITVGGFSGPELLAWPGGKPIVDLTEDETIAASDHYLAVDLTWYAAVSNGDLGFTFDFGISVRNPDGTSSLPLGVHVIRGGAVIANATFPDLSTFDGTAVFPFLAGDHLDLVAQTYSGSPGLCHPDVAHRAVYVRMDEKTSMECPFNFTGESSIEGAVLLPGKLIIGRRTFVSDGCGLTLNPVTIEAYALPGESLSTSGWVQSGGNPGLGKRPLHP